MKSKILKYRLHLKDEQSVPMPENHQILSAQVQNNELCLWVLVDPATKNEDVKILIFGTGFEIDYPGPETNFEFNFIDTVQQGGFVWHVFELQESFTGFVSKPLGRR
jgi:hypothetical protein